jgi:hypothetical protein
MGQVAIYHYGSYSPPLYNINANTVIDYGDKLDGFLSDPADYKLAMVEVNYARPHLTAEELTQLRNCNRVIVKSMELESRIIDIIYQFDLPNFTFVLNGILNQPLQNAYVDQEMFWMNSTAYPYQHEWVENTHSKLAAFATKPYMFDVLYGLEKPHRIFVKQLLSTADTNWFYQTPFFVGGGPNGQFQNLNFDQSDLWEDEIEFDPQWNYRCRYLETEMRISQVLPFKIYNKTAYTVVLETWADNCYSFFTEKIVKPMLAYRLFVVISGQYYLRNLRNLGFRTFDGIIDESYDNEPDNYVRWTQAIKQAQWLCQQPQQEILSQIAPVVLHNYRVLTNLNFSKVNQHAEAFLIQHGCYKT